MTKSNVLNVPQYDEVTTRELTGVVLDKLSNARVDK